MTSERGNLLIGPHDALRWARCPRTTGPLWSGTGTERRDGSGPRTQWRMLPDRCRSGPVVHGQRICERPGSRSGRRSRRLRRSGLAPAGPGFTRLRHLLSGFSWKCLSRNSDPQKEGMARSDDRRPWTEPRISLTDPLAEELRAEAYWTWLDN
jgi:hypothetical protein